MKEPNSSARVRIDAPMRPAPSGISLPQPAHRRALSGRRLPNARAPIARGNECHTDTSLMQAVRNVRVDLLRRRFPCKPSGPMRAINEPRKLSANDATPPCLVKPAQESDAHPQKAQGSDTPQPQAIRPAFSTNARHTAQHSTTQHTRTTARHHTTKRPGWLCVGCFPMTMRSRAGSAQALHSRADGDSQR